MSGEKRYLTEWRGEERKKEKRKELSRNRILLIPLTWALSGYKKEPSFGLGSLNLRLPCNSCQVL